MSDVLNIEYLSPYKLGLLLLLETHLYLSELKDQACQNDAEDCSFLLTIIDLINIHDLDLKTLIKVITSSDASNLILIDQFKERLKSQYEGKIYNIFFVMDQLNYVFFTRHGVNRSSFIGLFVRRIFLAFDKLLFNQIVNLFEKYSIEYLSLVGEDENEQYKLNDVNDEYLYNPCNEIENIFKINLANNIIFKPSYTFSQKQAEYFIAQQVKCIINNKPGGLNPIELNTCIRELTNSNFTEVNFFKFLNYLRVHEFVKANAALHQYFDSKKSTVTNKKKDDDQLLQCAYAPLLLVNFRHRFKIKHQDNLMLREVIRISQENNDSICLQHALGWLSRINKNSQNTRYMLLKLINTSSKFPLNYLTATAYQLLAKNMYDTSSNPKDTLNCIDMSKGLANESLMKDLNSICLAHKISVWNAFGNKEMLRLSCQILLNLKTINSSIYINEESDCLSLSFITLLFCDEGYYDEANAVIELSRSKFLQSSSNFSHYTSFAELWIQFHNSLYQSKFAIAENYIKEMRHLNIAESIYCRCLFLLFTNKLSVAMIHVEDLIEYCNNENTTILPFKQLFIRSLLLKADILYASNQHIAAMTQCIEALNSARKNYCIYLEALSIMHISHIQMNFCKQYTALNNLETIMPVIFANASKFERARFRVLRSKCMLSTMELDEKQKVMLLCIELLSQSIVDFEELKAFNCVNDLFCLLHILYVELGKPMLANSLAFKCKEYQSLHSIDSFTCTSFLF